MLALKFKLLLSVFDGTDPFKLHEVYYAIDINFVHSISKLYFNLTDKKTIQ